MQLLNRRPPFGHEILACAREFPEYSLRITELEVKSNGGIDPVEVNLLIECELAKDSSKSLKMKNQKGRYSNTTAVLIMTSDFEFIDFRRITYAPPRYGRCSLSQFVSARNLSRSPEHMKPQPSSQSLVNLSSYP